MRIKTEMHVLVISLIATACVLSIGAAAAKAGRNSQTRAIEDLHATARAQMGAQAQATDAAHVSLMKLAGDYNRIVKFLGQTGAMAAPSSGTCKISVVLGGRFLMEESHDVVFGKPVDGLRIYGYNDVTKQYEMARMYTMSNAITIMKGTSGDGGKTIVYMGEARNAGTGNLRATLRRVNENEFTVTMSTAGPNGKDIPFQETIYKRRK